MGYLLMPIIMVAFGKVVYKETLSLNKWLAIVVAFIGVASNILFTENFDSKFICLHRLPNLFLPSPKVWLKPFT